MNVHHRCHGSNLNIEDKSSKQRGANFLEKDGRCRPNGAGLPRRLVSPESDEGGSNAKAGGIFGLGFYKDGAPTALAKMWQPL
jgi:hypothetical protein